MGVEFRSKHLIVQHSSKSVQHYTPSFLIEKCREVMTYISLDPASCKAANSIVQATDYYSPERGDDGLVMEWYGNVFLNPPGGKINNKSVMSSWARKLINEYENGEVDQACFLAFNSAIFRLCPELTKYPFCIFYSRIAYLDERLVKQSSPPQDSSIFYLGNRREQFKEAFSDIGHLVYSRSLSDW